MFESLFGAELPLAVRFFIAFVIVLLLIGATFWLIRRFGADRLGSGSARGRQPRLAVIDAAAVDGRRRLVLIRRDNVEHLVLIGGPSDIVIEQNIVRAVPVTPPRDMPAPHRGTAGEPARGPETMPAKPESMIAPAARERSGREPMPVHEPGEHGWQDHTDADDSPRLQRPRAAIVETRPDSRPAWPAAPTPDAPPVADEGWRSPPPSESIPRMPRPVEPGHRREAPPSPRLEPEPMSARPGPEQPDAARSSEPPPEMQPSPPTADANLANMAQRLEAALRRPMAAGQGARPMPPSPRLAGGEPPVLTPPIPGNDPGRAEAPRAPAVEAKPDRAEPKPSQPKSVFDSLEEEMASLLGRPKSKE